MSNSKFVKGIKDAFVLFECDPPVSVNVESMRTVIERRKLKTDRNGNVRITPEMIAEAKALEYGAIGQHEEGGGLWFGPAGIGYFWVHKPPR